MLYRASNRDCQSCALKIRCCPTTPARKVPRSIHEGARDIARRIATSWQGRISRRLRKKVEMLFAHLKRILRLDRLRLRGPNGARDEFISQPSPRTSESLPSSFRCPVRQRLKPNRGTASEYAHQLSGLPFSTESVKGCNGETRHSRSRMDVLASRVSRRRKMASFRDRTSGTPSGFVLLFVVAERFDEPADHLGGGLKHRL
jgi:hypothetical protein